VGKSKRGDKDRTLSRKQARENKRLEQRAYDELASVETREKDSRGKRASRMRRRSRR
jgi:hypothetical protein